MGWIHLENQFPDLGGSIAKWVNQHAAVGHRRLTPAPMIAPVEVGAFYERSQFDVGIPVSRSSNDAPL